MPTINPFDLTGKVAIITGSTRGIGLGIAKAMQAAGAQIVISSEDSDDTGRVGGELATLGITADVTDDAALSRLVDKTVAHYGGIDILVCNAGVTGKPGPLAGMESEDYDRVMAINLRSQVILSNLALPHIATRGGGSAILMASISSIRGNGNIGAYALSKAAVAQLARNLAVEWGSKNVRVNAISPGFIHTELSAALLANPDFMTRRMAMTPLRRPGTVDEIAGTAIFLASAAGGFVTGHNLVVDGGTLITDGS